MGELLRLDEVSMSFGGLVALHDFSLSIKEGERVGLLGPNGAGKTTLFNLISGFLRPDSGSITFRGARVERTRPYRRTAMGLSRTFQITRPFPSLTVEENVVAGAVFGGGLRRQEANELSMKLLELVSLSEKAQLPARSLSLAEQRRLELARALATAPKLLLLDEVMAGLTPAERGSLLSLVARVSAERGVAMLVSEHVMASLSQLCSRLVVMDRGAKLAEGPTNEIISSDLVAEVYLGRAPVERV